MPLDPAHLLPAAVPLAWLAVAALARRDAPAARLWATTSRAALVALACAVAAAAWQGYRYLVHGTPADAPGLVVLLLVALLGWVIARYSARYLDGEPRQSRYVAALAFTLAAASVVVVAGNLLVLMLAWTATSLGLHALLTFYGERPAALVAAHKKFLASRAAEVALAGALALIWVEAGTFDLAAIAAHARDRPGASLALHAAAVLIALAAILKSAQLPVHGWLIQVMEAPTPVSALLHAGVVNLGGFVLIRTAAVFAEVPVAQALLVVVGALTAVLAGLVMATRISIKVRLAWSTCAQMGFMLMECGLGLYDLALLHLVAHAGYKAHAFLSAGETVRTTSGDALAGGRTPRRFAMHLVAGGAGIALVAGVAAAAQAVAPAAALAPLVVVIAGLGLAPLLAGEPGTRARGALVAVAVGVAYVLAHAAFGALVAPRPTTGVALAAFAAACFVALHVAQGWIAAHPHGRFARALYPHAYAGFHLDEWFTRLAFRVWPSRRPFVAPDLARVPVPVLPAERS